jgi:hypothetical protein
VIEASEELRTWYLAKIRESIPFREEQTNLEIEIVPDGDKAGARGAAVFAYQNLTG